MGHRGSVSLLQEVAHEVVDLNLRVVRAAVLDSNGVAEAIKVKSADESLLVSLPLERSVGSQSGGKKKE